VRPQTFEEYVKVEVKLQENFGVTNQWENQSFTEKKSGVNPDYISENLLWILDISRINRDFPAD
jgi:hypothetical protein